MTFLSVESIEGKLYNIEHVQALIEAMFRFLTFSKMAISTSAMYVDKKHVQFQQMVETSFAELEPAIKGYLNAAKVALSGMHIN